MGARARASTHTSRTRILASSLNFVNWIQNQSHMCTLALLSLFPFLSYARAHTYTHELTHTNTRAHTHTHTVSVTKTLSLILSLSRTHVRARARAPHTHTHTHKRDLPFTRLVQPRPTRSTSELTGAGQETLSPLLFTLQFLGAANHPLSRL